MNAKSSEYWPKIFAGKSVMDFDVSDLLAQQLIGWGNIVMGYQPPEKCDFYDVMEAASKITGAFTGTECKDAADRILAKRKESNTRLTLEELNDGYIVEKYDGRY
jgi:hypothetical protein